MIGSTSRSEMGALLRRVGYAAVELTTTSRGTPALLIAPTMARVPTEYVSTGAPVNDTPSTDTTASASSTIGATAAGSRASAAATVNPRPAIGNSRGRRVTAVTRCPAA